MSAIWQSGRMLPILGFMHLQWATFQHKWQSFGGITPQMSPAFFSFSLPALLELSLFLQFFTIMAPSQSMMTKFLYEGRVQSVDVLSQNSDCTTQFQSENSNCTTQIALNGDGGVATAQCGSDVQPVLLGASLADKEIDGIKGAVGTPEVVILDPASASPAHELAKARRLGYEKNRHWQDSWAARLPWAESVLGEDGTTRQVRCKICSDVEGRDKLLVPKLDSLWKHAGRRKATTSFGKVKIGEYYFLSTNAHVKNEKIYFARSGKAGDTVVQQVAEGAIKERKRKIVQFRAILWLLLQGRSMAQYESMKDLFDLLQVPDFPKKHWSASIGWEMADHLALVLADHTKQVISKASFFALSADEVTTIDSQSWLSLHLYVCIGFKRVPILLSLNRLGGGTGASAVRENIEEMLIHHSGLEKSEIAERLVCFGADGVSVFQGSRNGVTTQMKEHMAPFLFGIHCMAHRTNLAVEPLSNLPVVAKVEALCNAMYAYFSHSPKRHLEFQKLADLVETEGRRMLRNVKTRWLSLLEPLKRVMGEYKTLIAKMCEDASVKQPDLTAKQAAAKETARENYDLLRDVGTLLALPCLMPLLDSVNSLMKFAQSNNVFISDYIAAVKICQSELYMMYTDKDTAWQKEHFEMFYDIVHDHSYSITQEWVTDLNTGVESLAFRMGGHTYPAHSICALSGKKLQVGREDFIAVMNSVKAQCRDAAEMLILELDVRFPEVELMNALGVVFPQYWLQPNCDDLFVLHVRTLKAHFAVQRTVNFGTVQNPDCKQVDPILDGRLLSLQMSLFKLTMKSHAQGAMAEPRDENPLTKVWVRIAQNALMLSRLSEFIKLAEIAVSTVLGSVEDERTFSTLSFMKSKLRNRLSGHVDTCVKLFSQGFFTVETFPVTKAISSWREERSRRGADL